MVMTESYKPFAVMHVTWWDFCIYVILMYSDVARGPTSKSI